MIGSQLQTAIYSALTAADIAGDRIYDRVPDNPTFPYVTIGNEQVMDDGNTCQAGWEVYPDIHVWSRPNSGSKIELKTLMASIHAAVTGITTVSSFTLVSIQLESARSMRDPDGLTEHGVMTFRALLDPA